ncbi:MAG: glycosyltransferase [Candidatus Hydrogenedens sp.]|nr:glycosyltransferase [Candidatus Hydrogenedens sp.]
MKVVHVYKDYDPPVRGGMERHVALMCRYQKQWCDVEALVCSRSLRTERRLHDSIPVTAVGEWGRFQSAPLSPFFPWYLRRIPADVMVIHCPNPTAEMSWLLARPRAALVVRYQSDVVRQARAMRIYKPFQHAFFRRARMILPTSQQYLDSSETLRHFRDKCRVLPLGIVPEAYESPDPSAVQALRDQYGSFVFFCGVHRYYKGLPWLIRAAPQIDGKVIIAGDGPERQAHEALARQSGGDILFPGALSEQELIDYLHASAVVAFPSSERSEAFGLSMLEAHACGRPVVSTRLGTGVEFVNEDGVTGINVPPQDADALAVAINSLLQDPEKALKLGAQARERVHRLFTAEHVARQEYELYEEVLATQKEEKSSE